MLDILNRIVYIVLKHKRKEVRAYESIKKSLYKLPSVDCLIE